tara:strand:- start:165 stop:644 length:480 start_codon:yes stop_codon:yes gene_type:complete
MAIRRQFRQFLLADSGAETTDDLEAFIDKPQSIFVSGFGNANLTQSQQLMDNQFIVVQGLGSSPGLFATESEWVPRGYMNLTVESTSYYTNPDNRPQEGLSGTGSPYPITLTRQRSYNSFPRVYLQGGTTFDITYYMASSFIGSPDNFTGTAYTQTMVG